MKNLKQKKNLKNFPQNPTNFGKNNSGFISRLAAVGVRFAFKVTFFFPSSSSNSLNSETQMFIV